MATTILLVENHDFLRQSLHRWLKIAFPECKVIAVAIEAEAIALVQVDAPNAIVLDLALYDGNGFEAVERIRAVLPETPVVVLADYVDETYRLNAAASGASASVWKKMMLTELEPTLDRLLSNQNGSVKTEVDKRLGKPLS